MKSTQSKIIKPTKSYDKHKESKEVTGPSHSMKLSRRIKKRAYKSSLKSIRHDLPPGLRLPSKFIHAQGIDDLSSFLNRWLARPGPLFSASLLSLVGTALSTYFANHLGFSINSLLPIVLFGIGYVVATLADILVKLFFKRAE